MSNPQTLSSEESTRRLYLGLWLFSGVSLAGCIVLGYPLVGTATFVGCITAAIVVFSRCDGPIFDERDQRRQGEASRRTLRVLGISSAVVFPVTTALWALGVVEWPLWLTPIAFFVAGLAFVHVGSTMYETTQVA
ncbi:DUF2178 domain-containing protein [Haloferax sp. MBLA0076]|uniref:DUF2178 domain-containing protein n=1 Tax=Haloferax litoreum TaxID=2666140 RepID=A0A6A8GNB8_9EURY|nr:MULTISPECIES: DUF2178 domain-containing protein [Haloferax]KAB1190389.1 DUF2178 domain-containing protein [Haloferax sp. CBA1148]MRX23360.1 DUF2178 domain-containing protein [Haloferax litoreum]